jgi:thiol-disulfide isomerase/thioredoxin
MKYSCLVVSTILALVAPLLSQSAAERNSASAMALLERVSQHYAEAKSYHIEAVEERTESGELRRDWQRTLLKAAEAPGGRLYFDGRGPWGTSLRVADGRTEWIYHVDAQQYTKRTVTEAGSKEHRILGPSDSGFHQAQLLRKNLTNLTALSKSAEWLPDEFLDINSRKILCHVIRLEIAFPKKPGVDRSSDRTIWIDAAHEMVVKTVQHYRYDFGQTFMAEEEAITYSRAELNTAVPDALFTFAPSPEAELVDDFPDPSRPADLIGKAVPPLNLKSADGKSVSLASFRGRPVLIDIWATWCAPCVDGLPSLARIYREVKGKSLVLLTVDLDQDSQTAAEFLRKHHYDWPNFHDDGEVMKRISESGIPHTFLIDAQGKVVFDELAPSDTELRSAIANLGPQYGGIAHPAPQPCVASANAR